MDSTKYRPLSLQEIKNALPHIQWHHWQNLSIDNIQCDSRKVTNGSLMVAIAGTKFDGSEFLEDAINKGAVAVVAEHYRDLSRPVPFGVVSCARETLSQLSALYWQYPTSRMAMIGITGTNGKTTTSFLLANMLQSAGHATGIIGTTGYMYGQCHIPPRHTTPDPLFLQETLSNMVENGITHVVMEVSSHSLIQKRVATIEFQAGIFTNLGRDHLDYHQTMEEYMDAKSLLFQGLSSQAQAVFNGDDAASAYLRQKCAGQAYFFSATHKADVYAENITFLHLNTCFDVIIPAEKIHVVSPLPGLYNVYNVLAALTCAFALKLPIDRAVQSIGKVRVPGRMEPIDQGQPFGVFVDFAHTPNALESVLCALRPYCKGKLLLVFGCGGDRDTGKRAPMGALAARYADYTWITSDNPRSESPEKIAQQIEQGFSSSNYCTLLDREKAIYQAISSASPDDIVLIAGKGHETVQIIGQELYPFNDCDLARKFLSQLGFRKTA